RVQNEVFDTLLARIAADPFRRRARSREADGLQETLLGQAALHDFADNRVLERLSMYERRIEYSLYKSMNELQKLRLMRELEPERKKPPRPDNRWGKPQPACATEEATPAGACAGSGEASRQTKPIGRTGEAEKAGRWETAGSEGRESRSGGPLDAESGGDCVKRTQSAGGGVGNDGGRKPVFA
ncbi:MAG: hypothetical protein JW741_15935, partial [Sedimentisphaerales bacterium]|nr:hypothetical protein [Sedimentisphaerales bacterium]